MDACHDKPPIVTVSTDALVGILKVERNPNDSDQKPQQGTVFKIEDTSTAGGSVSSATTTIAPAVQNHVTFSVAALSQRNTAVPLIQLSSMLPGKPLAQHKLNDPNLQQIPTEELLGSVTTFYPSGDAESGHALRSSARVIHKMRMDSIRGTTPPPQDKRDSIGAGANAGKGGAVGGAGQAKTPNQQKQVRMVWSNQDKNLFFEALNECGKDFEGIANYLNTKKRRKDNISDHIFKLKDVRHLYYQFNQKVSKYLHFSDEVKKEAQELYALINYGEMRKKVPFQNKKYFHKLKDLVYKGVTTVREKGRNIRIKTPSCRALRKLNQLEEWQEEIRLPPRVDVVLKPATVSAWGRVQSLAQNPRVKISVTLQKRVNTLLQLLQLKWRHQDIRLVERISNMKTASASITSKALRQKAQHELELCTRLTCETEDGENQKILCFTPSKDAVIHRPMINLTEFLSSYSICLNSYEQRIGAKVRGETICAEKANSFKDRSVAKRLRHDSGSEKHSPDGKKVKQDQLKEQSKEDKGTENFVANFAGALKITNTSTESAPDRSKEGEGAEGEPGLVLVIKKSPPSLTGDAVSELADLKSPESNDSTKHLPVLSKLKLEPESGVSSVAGDNSNDGALFECEQSKLLIPKMEENNESVVAADDIIKTTVKRKEHKEKCGRRKDSKAGMSGMSNLHFKPLISDEVIQKIREGWTSQTVGDLTVGDLYIMFGEENKLHLEYAWVQPKEDKKLETGQAAEVTEGIDGPVERQGTNGQERPANSVEGCPTVISKSNNNNNSDNKCGDISKFVSNNEITVSARLKQLLQIASLNEKTGKRRCPCGHVCDRKIKSVEPITSVSSANDNLLFKQPMVPARSNNVATLANCTILPSPHMRYKQSRWWRMRVNRHQLPNQRVVLPNGTVTYPPVRYNNNHPVPSAKGATNGIVTSTVSSTQTPLHAACGTSSNSSNDSTANLVQPTASNGRSNGSANSDGQKRQQDDEHLTKLLEEKINSFAGTSSGNSTSSNLGNVASLMPEPLRVGDENSCLSLFDISLPSTSSTLIAELMSGDDVQGQLGDDEASNCTTISASRILRESPVDRKLLDTDMNDISLSSFLGHLDAAYENEASVRKRDSDQMNISIISESSVDYIARFEDIAAQLRAQQEQDSV